MILSQERKDWAPCRSRASAFQVPCLSFSICVQASYLLCQISDRITLAHTRGGGSHPLPSRTSTRSVWFQTWFIQDCEIYKIQLTSYFVKSFTFNGNLQSAERSRLFDRWELAYIDKREQGRGGYLLPPLGLITNWIQGTGHQPL